MTKRKYWNRDGAKISGFGIAYFTAMIAVIITDGLTWYNIRILLGQFLMVFVMLLVVRALEREKGRRNLVGHIFN